ncbi:hypothetical protein DFQ28_001383 [Apophysomyces sp. BC1034]|nr:hypothetical protein DFQ30_001633 [Apophysomyces sp. BC1015]KAG0172257.1 hypothetical protein DFQ29_008466 [Apophysomyces sp. BC1021]KAG0190901.1 hypothetical protein DFQ28_001383 [Apophysomyces sp. BC1034]
MAYAKIAGLEPQYGLYTSFVGVSIYCFFGTSKDISIGPISTVSLIVGQAVATVTSRNPDITGPEVAVTLALFAGIITVIIGLIRLGILVDFISGPAIAGYMTGSAITIGLSQWPNLFGLTQVSTHNAPYRILVDFLSNIQHTRLDIAFGITALILLYGIRFACAALTKRVERFHRFIFYFGIMRNGLIVLIGTIASFLLNLGKTKSPVEVIETVPAGFDAMGVPSLNLGILRDASNALPPIVIILILEHVSVAKSFGRIYNYTIDPNQEMLAIGISNVVGSFFGAYPATGGFSRTAIMARSGVKTPIAGVFSGAVVVLALYALTPAFYYIPEAVLAAVVIHAVTDLASSPTYLKELWKSSMLEFLVWLGAVVVTIFVDVEAGIYVAVGLSLVIMLFRFARAPITTMARLPLVPAKQREGNSGSMPDYIYVDESDPNFKHAQPPPPGIIILRPTTSILYPNAEHISELTMRTIKMRTKSGNLLELSKSNTDRAWNHQLTTDHLDSYRPLLRALVFDFGAVHRLDSTALQMLTNMRNLTNCYAGHPVEWHFANLTNPCVREDLLRQGFGDFEDVEDDSTTAESHIHPTPDIEHDLEVGMETNLSPTGPSSNTPFIVTNTHTTLPKDVYPFFHWDIDTAVRTIEHRWKKEQTSLQS